jgi:hypothetical protein
MEGERCRDSNKKTAIQNKKKSRELVMPDTNNEAKIRTRKKTNRQNELFDLGKIDFRGR